MNKKIKISIIMVLLSFVFISCGSDEEQNKKPQEIETMNSGKFTVYVDESIYPVLDSPMVWYQKAYPKVALTIERVSARKAMAELLGAKGRCIVIARDYLRDEDSLMQTHGVAKHLRVELADDALTFFATSSSPVDTLNAQDLYKIFTTDVKFGDLYPRYFKTEPELVISSLNSSEYANLVKLVAKGKPITKKLLIKGTIDSVKQYIVNHPNSIGIAYLSSVVHILPYKPIRIGNTDSTGKYEPPQYVHQGFIVQGRYPYIVQYYAYLLENRKNLPFWFASYLGKETVVQRYFNDYGIVPAYAKIIIKKED